MRNEYPDFGVKVNAFHYTEILPELAGDAFNGGDGNGNGKPKPKVAYHDSCYLARLCGVFEQPREFLLLARPEVTAVTLDSEGAETLCCGGGGGRASAEEDRDSRISLLKIAQVKAKGVDVLLTSCPYRLSMFADSAAMEETGIRVADLLEFAMEAGGARTRDVQVEAPEIKLAAGAGMGRG